MSGSVKVELISVPAAPTVFPLYHRYSKGPAGMTPLTAAPPFAIPPGQFVEGVVDVVMTGSARRSLTVMETGAEVQPTSVFVTVSEYVPAGNPVIVAALAPFDQEILYAACGITTEADWYVTAETVASPLEPAHKVLSIAVKGSGTGISLLSGRRTVAVLVHP